MTSPTGSNVWNTTLFIGWDEPGGTYDHVPPGAVPPPDPSAPAGQFGFTFDRSGYRVPAVIVSPWVEPGSVYTAEHRHTSMIATLRKVWDLGEPFTQRDAHAAPFDYVFTREVPTDPELWEVPRATPLTPPQIDYVKADQTLSTLGKAMLPGIIAKAKQKGMALPPQVEDPNFHLTPQLASDTITYVGTHFWPQLGPQGPALDDLKKKIGADLDAATKPLPPNPSS